MTAALLQNQTGKRRVVVIMRERGGDHASLRVQVRRRNRVQTIARACEARQHHLRRRSRIMGRAARSLS